jgi:hypothetical protein
MLGWTVDVVVEPWGWLGTFRRSPVTGLWYQGRHGVHLAGNLHPHGDRDEHRWGDADYASEENPLNYDVDVTQIMQQEKNFRPARFGDSVNFQFQVGERRRSGKGLMRTVLGYAYNGASEPVYIVRLQESGQLTAKRTWKAHDEYGPVIGMSQNPA